MVFFNTLKKLGIDGFLTGIIAMIALAYFFPQAGLMKEPFSLGELANYGVAVIFLFYGMRLGPEKLKAGLTNWKMHALIQLTTFVVFPLIGLAIRPLFANNPETWLGIFYLCALPSTVSSSVVMVSIAQGNIPAAIFNASFSSLAGVFITPLWMGFFVGADTGMDETGSIITKLILQILLPVSIGMLLNKKMGEFAETHKQRLRYFDQSIILLIIYTSFCHSFADNFLADTQTIGLIMLGMTALFFAVFLFMKMMSRLFRFSTEDTITVQFCGSKKSLVHGTVMANVLFPNAANLGLLLLPLMIYHALQLVYAGILARRFADREQTAQEPETNTP